MKTTYYFNALTMACFFALPAITPLTGKEVGLLRE